MKFDFQGNSSSNLKIRFNLKHVRKDHFDGNMIECERRFMNHRKGENAGTGTGKNSSESINCFICDSC